jgi:hypothetical protein
VFNIAGNDITIQKMWKKNLMGYCGAEVTE